MNCPECGHEMTLGALMALCSNCGMTAPLPEGDAASKPAPASAGIKPKVILAPEPKPEAAFPEPGAVFISASVAPTGAFVPPASVASPTSVPPADLPPDNMFAPAVGPRRVPWGKLAFVLIPVALLLGGGAYGYNAFVLQPKNVLLSYLDKLASAKTGGYSGTISYKSDAGDQTLGLNQINLTFDGKYDVSKTANPKTQVSLTGKSGTYGLSAELRELDKTVFFKLGSLDLVQNFGLPLSKDWYKIALDDNATVDKCTSTPTKNSHSVLGATIPTDLPLKNVKLVSFSEKIAGHNTAHYSGALDKARLQGFIDKANQELSADCKITTKASDLGTTTISYDIWTGKDFDRLKVVANDSKSKTNVEATIDTSGYNKPVNITAPSGAKDLKDLFSGLGDTGADTSATDGGAAVPVDLKARDTKRKTDLTTIRKGLEEYFVNNNFYPTTLAMLTQGDAPIISKIPTDPTNKAPYIYAYVPGPKGCVSDLCNTYTLTAKLENTKDNDPNVENGNFVLLNGN